MEVTKVKRIYWIDLAKIFAMFLIIISHTIAYSSELQWLYKYVSSFHVAFFFVISGLTFKIEKYDNYKIFIKEKFKRIMVPYFVFAILFLIPYIFLGTGVAKDLERADIDFNIQKSILGVFYGNGHDNYLRQNSSLWFLPCLFVTEAIFYFIEKNKNKYKYYIAIILSIIFGAIDSYLLPIRFPWGFDIAICMIAFFAIGKIIVNVMNVIDKKKNNKILYALIGIACIVIGAILQIFNDKVMYMHNKYGNYIIFIISAIFSIAGYIFLIKQCKNNKILEYAGNRTLAILIFHKIIVILFQTKIDFTEQLLKNGNILEEIIITLLVILISIIGSLIIEKICDKLCPWTLGIYKKNNEKNKLKIGEKSGK